MALDLSPCRADESGRWWWDADIGLAGRRIETRFDGIGTEIDERELLLGVGLNGVILHPRFAQFNLDLDLALTNLDGTSSRDTHRWGGAANFRLLPRGKYPSVLYFRRQLYDYSDPLSDPLTVFGLPDQTTVWGGAIRVRRGAFRGLRFACDQTRIDFLNPNADQDVRDTQSLDWAGGTRVRHRLRLDRRLVEFGTVGQGSEQYTLQIEESGPIGDRWSWRTNAYGVRRDLFRDQEPSRLTDQYRLHNRFIGDVRERDQVDLSFDYSLTRPDVGPSNDFLGLTAFYRWQPSGSWQVAPFTRHARQTLNGSTVVDSRLGISTTLRPRTGALGTVLTGRMSYGNREEDEAGMSMDQSSFAYAFVASLSHGDVGRLHKNLEVEVSHNELRRTRYAALEFPDLGLNSRLTGGQDLYRGRLSFAHKGRGAGWDGWASWTLAEGADGSDSDRSEQYQGGLRVSLSGLAFQASAGGTKMQATDRRDQELSFASADVAWSPLYFLTLRASYREDLREVRLLQDVEGDKIEARATLRLGSLNVEAWAYRTTTMVAGSDPRRSTTVQLAVTTRLAGWLPVVTGTKRRGVIR